MVSAAKRYRPVPKPACQLTRREDSQLRGGQLQRERKAVQPRANVGEVRGVSRRDGEAGVKRLGAAHEKCHGGIRRDQVRVVPVGRTRHRQRCDRDLPLRREMQPLAARGKDPQVRAGGQGLAELG